MHLNTEVVNTAESSSNAVTIELSREVRDIITLAILAFETGGEDEKQLLQWMEAYKNSHKVSLTKVLNRYAHSPTKIDLNKQEISHCLNDEFKKLLAKWTQNNGTDERCNNCNSKGLPCFYMKWADNEVGREEKQWIIRQQSL